MLDASLDVFRSHLGRDIALNGSDSDDFEPRIKKGEGKGEGVVDSGIAVDDDFSGHGFDVFLKRGPADMREFTVFEVDLGGRRANQVCGHRDDLLNAGVMLKAREFRYDLSLSG